MDAAELEWIAWTTPITTSLGAALAASDFSGRTVACRQHILADTICIVTPFVEAGARVRLAPCNPDSTDDRTVAHLASIGVEVRAHAGMSAGELDESLAWLVGEPADALCDMGGDLTPIRRHLERYELDGRRVYLLNRGSLVNLTAGLGIGARQLFDPFAAIMLLGLDAILSGQTADLPNGVQRYPRPLEARVARALATGSA